MASLPRDETAVTTRETRKPGYWTVVIVMATVMAVSSGSVANYGLSMLLKQVTKDLAWTRGGASNAASIYLYGLAIGIPVYGALIDRWGPRWPAVCSVSLFSAFLGATSFASGKLAFTILLGLAGLVSGGTTIVPYAVTIASRFENGRGLALGIGSAGVGLGGLLLPWLIPILGASGGWRTSLFWLALIIPAISLPGALLALNLEPVKAASAVTIEPVQSPWRSPAFRRIALSVALIAFGFGAIIVHAVALLTDRGISSKLAALTLSYLAVAVVIGRITAGHLMDRFHAPFVAAGFFTLAAVGFLILLLSPSLSWATAAMILVGLTAGSEADAIAYLTARYVKRGMLGRANGMLLLIHAAATASGVAALGSAYDRFGSYNPAFLILIPAAIGAAFVIATLGPYAEQ